MRSARFAAPANASTRPFNSARLSSCGVCHLSLYGIADGATVRHGDSSDLSACPPAHGTCADPLRPACASWMPIGDFVSRRQASTTRFIAASLLSWYRPVQPCVMRPSRVTPVASIITSPAPEIAMLPRCTRCQSVMLPSSAEYWHIGDTATRFGSVMPPSRIGSKSLLVMFFLTKSGILHRAVLSEVRIAP